MHFLHDNRCWGLSVAQACEHTNCNHGVDGPHFCMACAHHLLIALRIIERHAHAFPFTLYQSTLIRRPIAIAWMTGCTSVSIGIVPHTLNAR